MTEVQMRKYGRYFWPPDDPEGESLPGVTMITGKLDKSGALSGSAAKITAEYAVENMLAWETLPPEEAIKQIKAQYRDEWNGKATRGSNAHKAIADWMVAEKAHEVAELEDLDMLPYVAGAAAFVMDNVKKIGAVEATVFNLTYKYAGTFDALVRLNDDSYAIIDWKTGGIYEDASLQLAAYAHAQFIGRPDGTRIDLEWQITKGIVVQVPGDGTYTAFVTDFECGGKCEPRKECGPFRGFVGLRGVQKWEDKVKPHVWTEKRKGSAEEENTDAA